MSHLQTIDQIRARFKNVSSGGPKLRVRIELPNVPLALLEQAQPDDDLSIVLARRRALFECFGLNASADTKQEAEKLVSAMAAKMFPAYRQRSKEFPKRPGRPPAYRPKHEVKFLKEVAEAYDNTKNKVKNYRTAPPSYIYKIFLQKNPILANKLKVQGRPLQLSSFNKLLAVGRSARNQNVVWHKDVHFATATKCFGYVAINDPIIAADYSTTEIWSSFLADCALSRPAFAAIFERLSSISVETPWFNSDFADAEAA
jgi:hypothetical protein